jgi:hypothetical protein
MLTRMNRNALPKTRRRGWLTMMLVVASVRVFAGVPALDIGEHAAGAHSLDFALVAEHSYEVSGDGDHLHCHNCCAHAPVAVSSTPSATPTKTPIVASVYSLEVTTAPTFTHFRPPRA